MVMQDILANGSAGVGTFPPPWRLWASARKCPTAVRTKKRRSMRTMKQARPRAWVGDRATWLGATRLPSRWLPPVSLASMFGPNGPKRRRRAQSSNLILKRRCPGALRRISARSEQLPQGKVSVRVLLFAQPTSEITRNRTMGSC